MRHDLAPGFLVTHIVVDVFSTDLLGNLLPLLIENVGHDNLCTVRDQHPGVRLT